jgi:photosystem II stability/assembly factor-like uncharacterized protein
MFPRVFLIPIFLFVYVWNLSSDEPRMPAGFARIGPFGGDVRSLLVDSQNPEVAYLGTSSGKIFKTRDNGKSWEPLFPGIGLNELVVDTLVQHPRESNHIYAGAWDLHSEGGGLFESKDAGLSWSQIRLPVGSAAVRGLAICKTNPVYMIVGTLSGACVSADSGRSWKKVGGAELQKAESVAIDPKNQRFLYVGTWRLGYRSEDFGKTWTRSEKGMPLDSDLFSISINAQDPQIIYASACSGVYRSTNRALSWTRLRLLPDRFTIRALAVCIDPKDVHRIYVGTTEGLFTSGNDGETWRRSTSAELSVNAIQVDPGNTRRITIGTEYSGILVSEDAGQTWRESNLGFSHQQISWFLPRTGMPSQFLGGVLSGAGGICIYDSKSQVWNSTQIEPGARILSYLELPNNKGRLAGTVQGIYWQAVRSDPWKKLPGSAAKRTIYSLELDSTKQVIYAGTDRGIYRTSLSALDFRVPPNYQFSPETWCITAPETSKGAVYAGTSLGLLRSWDQGTTWNVISAWGLPARTVFRTLVVSPARKEHLFAGTSAGLFESKDGGVHWDRAGSSSLQVDVPAVLFLDDSGEELLAANKTSGGVFQSVDGGRTWELIFSPHYGSPVYCLTKDPQQPSIIYAGTRSEGVYRIDLSQIKKTGER